MSRGVILTVGNRFLGDDGAGPWLAELLASEPAPGWTVVDGGDAPENHIHTVRKGNPELAILVDAAQMGQEPGTILRIEPERVLRPSLFNTHIIPLDMLIESLRMTIPKVIFLGIQPAEVKFDHGLTPQVRQAVERLHRFLAEGHDPESIPFLDPDSEAVQA